MLDAFEKLSLDDFSKTSTFPLGAVLPNKVNVTQVARFWQYLYLFIFQQTLSTSRFIDFWCCFISFFIETNASLLATWRLSFLFFPFLLEKIYFISVLPFRFQQHSYLILIFSPSVGRSVGQSVSLSENVAKSSILDTKGLRLFSASGYLLSTMS